MKAIFFIIVKMDFSFGHFGKMPWFNPFPKLISRISNKSGYIGFNAQIYINLLELGTMQIRSVRFQAD